MIITEKQIARLIGFAHQLSMIQILPIDYRNMVLEMITEIEMQQPDEKFEVK